MRAIAVINQKGGVGKTTTSVNLAAGLALQGMHVLLVDLDAQGSATLALGQERRGATYRLLMMPGDPPQLATARPGLELLASDDTLADARDALAGKMGRDARAAVNALGRALSKHAEAFDFVIVDCAPSLDVLTLNALMFAREVMVPVKVDFLSAAGTAQHLDTLEGLRDMGGRAELRYVVPTFVEARQVEDREIAAELHRYFGELVTSPIRKTVALSRAPHARKTIFEFDPASTGAADYRQLVLEVLHGR